MSEFDHLNFEVRSRKSEVGSMKSEVGSRKSEVRSWNSEVRTQKSEVGTQKSEVGSRKSEVGSRKSKVGSPSSAFVRTKGWFPYDRRRSQIADRRRSQRELFPYNRGRSQAIAEPTVAYISDSGTVKITRLLCWREIAANNMADVEEEILLQTNLFLLLVNLF